MKIAIDLDKNYEFRPVVFDHIAKRFQDAGHKVGIITGRHEKEGSRVNFTPDFVIFLDSGDYSYELRARMKSEKMLMEEIDLIFDDRAEYFPKSIVALKIV